MLDELELMRAGILAGPVGPDQLVSVSLPPELRDAGAGDTVELTDGEGVPVAQVPLAQASDGLVAAGAPTWLSPRSSRPFEDLHVTDSSSAEGPERLVVVDGPVDGSALEKALAGAGRVTVLALASLDGEPAPAALAAVRSAHAAATGRPEEVRAMVAPWSPRAPQAGRKRELILRALAGGAEVVEVPRSEPDAAGAGLGGGTVLFFTGLSGSGKSTVARAVRNYLLEAGQLVTLLDGDLVRRHLSKGLGFSAKDRDTNIRRIGWVSAEIAYHGGMAICSPIAPFDRTRRDVRTMVEERGGRFLLVHVATPLAECERRDRKGLYAKARRGEIPEFTGISSPYEEPEDADLRIDTTGRDVTELRDVVLAMLDEAAPRMVARD